MSEYAYEKEIIDSIAPIWQKAKKRHENLEFWKALVAYLNQAEQLVEIGNERFINNRRKVNEKESKTQFVDKARIDIAKKAANIQVKSKRN